MSSESQEAKRDSVDIVATPTVAEQIMSVPKLSADEIRKRMKEIDAKVVASEVLDWLIQNVENYIDNCQKTFRLVLTVVADIMPVTKALQDLYMAVPDEEGVIGELMDGLDAVTEKAKLHMQADKERTEKLFKRLVFFYEMTGFNNVSGPIVQQMDGCVEITEFLFDPVSMTLQVKQPVVKIVDGQPVETGEKRVVKEIPVPEGFGVELSIDYWPKRLATTPW